MVTKVKDRIMERTSLAEQEIGNAREIINIAKKAGIQIDAQEQALEQLEEEVRNLKEAAQ